MLREEREQQRLRKQILLRLKQRDEVIRRLEKQLCRTSGESNPNLFKSRDVLPNGLIYKFKPDTYDRSALLREFLAQFGLIVRANNWDESAKVVALAASLRGKARAILEGVVEFESLRYSKLESWLESCFGEGHMAQMFTIY